MKIYWSMHSVPELDGLARPEKRKRFRELQKQGRKRMGAMPYVYFVLAAFVAAVAAALLNIPLLIVGGLVGGLGTPILLVNPAIDHGRVWYRDHYGSD